jgi:hypothetical protein
VAVLPLGNSGIKEILRCVQILGYLKSKYLLFFPARRVFRYARIDVTGQFILFINLYSIRQKEL